ncbi:hypothetical protein PSTG_04651 [Puccinia striiformis f. sp. tritici PST-78]|uniref:Tyr recombinase domain-containing protein n=1 Tax=Puccinia striiformis f. sp. tritici PST-78 TaxID=1165861 RepID=A0A0L0VSA5_9BASI|nr:hypothetical protein PSTG_04651 [Puccinia striiformis f. sp. tritici PST-78]
MNVEKWREVLERHGLLPEFQDVLDGFVSGFDQGIPEHYITGLNFFTPDNHSSSEVARDKIEASIKKELAGLRMFGPFSQEAMEKEFGFFRSNPLGAVVNNDGSVRPINDLSYPRGNILIPSVNSFVNADHFKTTWDDFKTVSKFFSEDKRPFDLALFDWEKAYRQIPTKRRQWKYLLVKDFDGNFLVDTRITFGGVAGCGSFGRPADAWKLIMKNEFKLINVFRWVDDNLFVKLKTDLLTMEEVIRMSSELGVMTNENKGSPFSEEQKFIGFVWNGVAKTVRLPDGKIEQRINQISTFLKIENKFSYEDVEILVGRLNHVTYLLPHLRCNLCSLYRWLKSWMRKRAKQHTPVDVLKDLNVWVDTLENYEHTRIISWGPAIDIGWVGDASTSFGIGVLIGKRWAQFKLVDQRRNPKRISLLETVAVRLGLLMVLQIRCQDSNRLVVWTDNTTTENSINNKKSRDVETNAEWSEIQKLLLSNHVDLVAKRVTSKNNKADALSRGLRSGQDSFLSGVQDFTSDGMILKRPSEMDIHVLNGWGRATLKGYNSAVRKFLSYMRSIGRKFRLPAQAKDIYEFCFWCGKTATKMETWEISSVTLKKYLSGLKAWHDYHGQTYPGGIDKKVGLMVKSSAKEDAKRAKRSPKGAIKLHHLLAIADSFSVGSNEEVAILDLSIVAFWGMARLGEITYGNQIGNVSDGPRREDVKISRDMQSAVISLRNAKTAKPGELQYIRLVALRNALCPVLAIQRRVNSCVNYDDSLFGFQTSSGRSNLTKYRVISRLEKLWHLNDEKHLSGHSFRVGGASLRNALGVPIEQICDLGRWVSSSYKLYIRTYTVAEIKEANELLMQLNFAW